MPFIYVEANDEFIIEFSTQNYLQEWDSASAEEICEKYGHPKYSIDFRIENESDPLSPMLIFVANTEAYEGELLSEKINETSFKFKINGKFKTSVHKDTVAAIKGGATPVIYGATRFREMYGFDDGNRHNPGKGSWIFSAKKL